MKAHSLSHLLAASLKKSPSSIHRAPPPPAHNGVPAAGSPVLSASPKGRFSPPSRTRRLFAPPRSQLSQRSSPTRSSSRRAPAHTGVRRRGMPPLLRPANHSGVAPLTSGGALLSHWSALTSTPTAAPRLQVTPASILHCQILTIPSSSDHRRESPIR